MANNKVLERNSPLTIGVPAAAAVTSGQPLLFGSSGRIACVANESDGDPAGTGLVRASTGNVSVDTEGAFNLTVVAKSTLSPAVNAAVNVGDAIYADGGTVDATTNVRYGFTLDRNNGGILFGTAVGVGGGSGTLIAAGSTGVIAVLLKGPAGEVGS